MSSTASSGPPSPPSPPSEQPGARADQATEGDPASLEGGWTALMRALDTKLPAALGVVNHATTKLLRGT